MKNTMKLFGIVALAAVIGFGTMACSAGGDTGIAVTYAEIILADGSSSKAPALVATGTKLEAYYEPADATDVSYEWTNVLEGNIVGTSKTFTPEVYGIYELVVSGVSGEPDKVTATKYIDFFGTWKAPHPDGYDEYVVLTDVLFNLNASYADGTPNGYVKIDIEGDWVESTAGTYKDYKSGYTMSGKVSADDYPGWNTGETQSINVYLSTSNKLSLTRSGPNGTPHIEREYVKQ